MPDAVDGETDFSDVEVELTEPSSEEEVSSDQPSSSSSESESESEEESSSDDDDDLADSDEEEAQPKKAAPASKGRPAAAPRTQPARPAPAAAAATAPAAAKPKAPLAVPAATKPRTQLARPVPAARPAPAAARLAPAAAAARPAPAAAAARPKSAPKPAPRSAASEEEDGPEDAASESEPEEEEEASGSDSDGGGDGEEEATEEGGGGDDDDAQPSPEDAADRREENIRAMLDGTLDIHRKPLLPKLLTVVDASATLRRPFKSPHPAAPARSEALKRALAARKQFVPWGAAGKAFLPPIRLPAPADEGPGGAAPAVELPEGVEPLVLWEPPPGTEGSPVRVDDALTRFLRPHQREGVQFMFECVAGLRGFGGAGCILADDMGLGKTLQGIALLWTLLNGGHEALGGAPLARRVIICCPTSLVSNWDSECTKWLNGRVRTLPLCESSRDDVIAGISQFLSPRCPAQLLILSYETFRLHAERFRAADACDLLICDEAHRLKNDATQTNRALAGLACRRRVLLSGTPMQNQLQEFYAMVNFCNPGVLGSPAEFRRRYEAPILAGREPDASDADAALGAERSAALSEIVNEFILRRTNSLLSAHLPPKVVEVVACRMTPLQYDLYCHFVQSRSVQSIFATQKSARALSAITSLRKLLNHPKLIYDMVHSPAKSGRGTGTGTAGGNGFEHAGTLFPPGVFDAVRGGGLPPGWELLSGKFAVVARMLGLLRAQTRDRIVIVSNYTQTLDLFAALCRERGYPVLRLDGSTSIGKRQKLVKRFNDAGADEYVFLLSSKAGGCGINLVGGNRLILFDMSWNPADDKQAAARVWRDGQRRRVYVYRFMTTGTIEEKVYQRQLSKEGLQAVVDAKGGGGGGAAVMTLEELRDLFSYDPDTLSTTYDHMVAAAGVPRERKKDKPPARRGRPPKGGAAAKKKKKAAEWETDSEGSEPEALPETEEDSEIVIVDSDSEGEEAGGGGDEASSAEKAAAAAAAAAAAMGAAPMEVEGGEGTPAASPAAAPAPAAGPAAGAGRALLSAALARAQGGIRKPQVGAPKEEDLASWGHHSDPSTVPDECMALTGAPDVTFVFSCQVEGREVPPDPPLVPLGQGGKAAGGTTGAGPSGLGLRRGGAKPGSAGPPPARLGSAGPPGVKRATPLGPPVKRTTPLGPPAKTAPAPAAAGSAAPPPPKSAPAPKVAGTKRPSPNAENRAQAAPPAAATAPAPKRGGEQAAKRRSPGGASAPAPSKAMTVLYDSDDDDFK